MICLLKVSIGLVLFLSLLMVCCSRLVFCLVWVFMIFYLLVESWLGLSRMLLGMVILLMLCRGVVLVSLLMVELVKLVGLLGCEVI